MITNRIYTGYNEEESTINCYHKCNLCNTKFHIHDDYTPQQYMTMDHKFFRCCDNVTCQTEKEKFFALQKIALYENEFPYRDIFTPEQKSLYRSLKSRILA